MSYSDNVVGYVRVSTDEQGADWKTSLQHQRSAISALAEKLGVRLDPKHVFEDRFSGGTAVGRPEFMALVHYCEEHPRDVDSPGYALFLNDSRFGRFDNPDEAAFWRFQLAQCGWIARFAEGDDTEDLIGRHLLRAIGSASASAYRQQIKKNASQGGRDAAKKGLWQTEAPIGYRRLAFGGGREPVVLDVRVRKAEDQQVRLTPGPSAEVAVVRWIFERYDSGEAALGELERELRTRDPGRRWSKQQVGKILSNRVYVGEVIWGRRRGGGGKRRPSHNRPKSEWVVTPDAHPAIIDEALFARVQQRLKVNKRRTRATRGGYPLSGLITCKQCGSHFVGGGGKRGPVEDPDRYRFYKCSGAFGYEPVCEGPIATITKRVLERLVIGEVANVLSAPGIQGLIATEVARQLSPGGDELAEQETRTRMEIGTLEKRRENLVGAIADGLLQREEAESQLATVREGLAEAERRLAALTSRRRVATDVKKEQERLIKISADFAEQAARLSGAALRELLAPWLARAEFDKERRILEVSVRRVPVLTGFGEHGTEPLVVTTRFSLEHPLSPYCKTAREAPLRRSA